MVELAKSKYNVNKDYDLQDLFILGLLHDIGYQFTDKKEQHNFVGGKILKRNNYKYWQEVYYHGDINTEYDSLFLKILNDADMQVDNIGNYVNYEQRLENIKNRYGENSFQYINSKKLIEKIKSYNIN